jgi:hypothetical protein
MLEFRLFGTVYPETCQFHPLLISLPAANKAWAHAVTFLGRLCAFDVATRRFLTCRLTNLKIFIGSSPLRSVTYALRRHIGKFLYMLRSLLSF